VRRSEFKRGRVEVEMRFLNWISALLAIQRRNVIKFPGAGFKTLDFAGGTIHKFKYISTF